jgi:hypothetical protein
LRANQPLAPFRHWRLWPIPACLFGRVRFTPVTTCFAPDHKPGVGSGGALLGSSRRSRVLASVKSRRASMRRAPETHTAARNRRGLVSDGFRKHRRGCGDRQRVFRLARWPKLLCACPPQRLGSGRAPSRCSARAAGDAAGMGPG